MRHTNPATLLSALGAAANPGPMVRPSRYTPLFEACIKVIEHLLPTCEQCGVIAGALHVYGCSHDGETFEPTDCPDCHTEGAHDVRCEPESFDMSGAPTGPEPVDESAVPMKKCPACGANPQATGGQSGMYVTCDACPPIFGPEMLNPRDALVAWNAVVDAWNGGFATGSEK